MMPLVAVVAGKFKLPFSVRLVAVIVPLTSSVETGEYVPMPTLPTVSTVGFPLSSRGIFALPASLTDSITIPD